MPFFLKRLLVQISMVSSRGMLVKCESIHKLHMKLLESCSTISMSELNESLTVYLLVINGFKIGTKNFASLYEGVCKADIIVLKDGQPSIALCFHSQLILLRELFQKNGYPENFIDRCFKMLLHRTPILK